MNKKNNFVRKSIISSLIVGLLFTVSTSTTYAAFEITTVRGQVIGPDGQPFKHAKIVVTCDGETEKDKTNGNGNYKVQFRGRNVCDEGSIATITASKDGKTGSTTGVVQERRDGRFVDRNFLVADAIHLPEFGLVTGAFAAFASAGMYLRMRKRS